MGIFESVVLIAFLVVLYWGILKLMRWAGADSEPEHEVYAREQRTHKMVLSETGKAQRLKHYPWWNQPIAKTKREREQGK
jgi:hypothetical protein